MTARLPAALLLLPLGWAGWGGGGHRGGTGGGGSPLGAPAAQPPSPAAAVRQLAGWAAVLPMLQTPPGLPGWLSWRPHLPVGLERWLYNPRQRTAEAIAAAQRGDPKAAMEHADAALRLVGAGGGGAAAGPAAAPALAPLTHYNAGTAHLLAGDARGAAALLDRAVESAGAKLAPTASYNLGNARFAAGDAAGAVEAYKRALRAAPGNADAKWNLELALHQRERDRLRAKTPREGQRGDRQGGKESSSGGGGADNPADREPRRSDAHDPGPAPQTGQSSPLGRPQGAPRDRPNQADARQAGQPLPGFRDQPEMSAREAAAVLQAVENLERQHRREAAARLARQRAANGEDW
ncbi:MAG TPA: tetratricopeptide repeat protein [Thermoanaerobaculia bacterium]|nr:tetratricopeptide repeat protein [Thermoanaerobaculia bacterium]